MGVNTNGQTWGRVVKYHTILRPHGRAVGKQRGRLLHTVPHARSGRPHASTNGPTTYVHTPPRSPTWSHKFRTPTQGSWAPTTLALWTATRNVLWVATCIEWVPIVQRDTSVQPCPHVLCMGLHGKREMGLHAFAILGVHCGLPRDMCGRPIFGVATT